jgi:hypothetical protein
MTIDDIATQLRQSEAVGAETLFTMALESYASNRIENVDVEKDGDMLLFQWRTFGQGQDRQFTVDLTRQTILDLTDPDDAADSMRQLHVTAAYPCSADTEKMGKGQEWCSAPHDIKRFSAFVKAAPAYLWAVSHQPLSLEVNIEDV